MNSEFHLSLYADILLPLAQPLYTFAVPEGMLLEEGMAVTVPFGRKNGRLYTGIVWRLHDRAPAVERVKCVGRPLYGGRRLLTPDRQRLWEWVADYYMCTPGEVMRVALPSLMKPAAADAEHFAEREYRPRTERYLLLGEELEDEAQLNACFEQLARRAPKQYDALLELAALRTERKLDAVPRRLLRAEMPLLNALAKKGYIRIVERERSSEPLGKIAFQLPLLSAAQQQALDTIRRGFERTPTVLLHGITGSGKTEIYIHLIAETLAAGDDVLMLVPEIALTTQLIERLERIFGSRVTPYHSKLTDVRRTETYLNLSRSEGGEFVVGARSALFLPLRRLKLIIVDEEHDTSYKQTDPAPRYNARDCAVAAARLLGCRTLLGSATPSIESWSNARRGKYGLARLDERYGDARPPRIIVSDTLRAVKRGERKSHFNHLLIGKIGAALARREQVILFQNRRGFSPFVICPACGWTARCPRCDVSLTWHKGDGKLVCHYCGHSEPMPDACPECGGGELAPAGFGTEKVEQEIGRLFPEARLLRMDRDSVNSESAFKRTVAAFERGEGDILIGTRMLTKGLDFGNVSLVGVLNADNLLYNPDFRASERAFQLLTQVAGRAGRRSAEGEVVIQTSDPSHPIIRQVVEGDFEGMALRQLAEREAYAYPPYARIIRLMLRHRDRELVRRTALLLAGRLRERFGRRVLGPVPPPVDRIRDEYRVDLLLKIESGASMRRARELLRTILTALRKDKALQTVLIACDVDPQ